MKGEDPRSEKISLKGRVKSLKAGRNERVEDYSR